MPSELSSLMPSSPLTTGAIRSCPTRRSSDLLAAGVRVLPPALAEAARIVAIEPRAGAEITADYFPRSEEHTSELQSLRHLVCRLLLEKKKRVVTSSGGAWSQPTAPRFDVASL